MQSVKKRQRSANFTPNETKFLLLLVEEFKEIIENPKTDNASAAVKHAAWEEITRRFNAHGEDEYRPVKVLREKYRNVKQHGRRKRPAGSKPIATQLEIHSMPLIKEETITGSYDDFACDATTSSQHFNDSIHSADNMKCQVLEQQNEFVITEQPLPQQANQAEGVKVKRLMGKKIKKKNLDEAIKRAQLLLTKKQVRLCQLQIDLFKLKLEKLKNEM